MADNITKKDYITITDKKVMVGGKATTKYRGCDIWRVKDLPILFKDIQAKVKQEYGSAPIEMHILSSGTLGQGAKLGTPSATHGPNGWVQFVFANGTKTPWVFNYSYSSASDCAVNCAFYCGYVVRYFSAFRSGVFGSVADAIKDYITITDTKVMVGGKATTKYRGCDIWDMEALPSLFKDIQAKVKQEYGSAPIEMHVLSSGTSGRYAKPGTPSAEPGKNAWASFVFANGTKTPWVFYYSYSSASVCAANCASHCGLDVRYNSDFRSGVFGPVADKIKALESPAPVSCNKVTQYKADEIRDICVGNQILRVKVLSVKNKTL